MASLLPNGKQSFETSAGTPLVGGRLYTYAAGTTTPKATYADAAETTPNTNPVILDARGEATVFWSGAYKAQLRDALDAVIWTVDGVVGSDVQFAQLAGSAGASLVGYLPAGTSAVPTNVQAKLRETVSVRDFWSGTGDATAATQAAINAASVVTFVAGYTYNLTGDIAIPANRKIIVEKGATVINTGGRLTAYDVDNVEFQIDGWVRSVAMAAAPAKTGWPSVAAGTEVGSCRGFIEFGGPDAALAGLNPRKGFWVHGAGKVSGDWTGTPNAADLPTAVNRRGIIAIASSNVLVEGLEVFGFLGEAVYSQCWGSCSNNVFRNNYVHDTQFNALNFNATPTGGGMVIENNFVTNAYQGIETACGVVRGNIIATTIGTGIYTGLGSGVGPIVIEDNTVTSAGLHSIATAFASGTPVTNVFVRGNTSINPAQYAVFASYCRNLEVRDNVCIGTGQSAGSYDIGLFNTLRAVVNGNTFLQPGPSAQPERIVVVTSFDVSIGSSNTYIATTGTLPPVVDGGVGAVASAATVTLPSLGKIFTVTGTTNITSMVATGNNGREVKLIFAGVLTFTDGSNLKLAGNFVTTADDTITLVCDGTNWLEICRSVN